MNALFQLASVFYSEADTYRATVEKIIKTVPSHTFAVEPTAKLLENGQSSKATYYNHIHALFSLYTLSLEQQDSVKESRGRP